MNWPPRLVPQPQWCTGNEKLPNLAQPCSHGIHFIPVNFHLTWWGPIQLGVSIINENQFKWWCLLRKILLKIYQIRSDVFSEENIFHWHDARLQYLHWRCCNLALSPRFVITICLKHLLYDKGDGAANDYYKYILLKSAEQWVHLQGFIFIQGKPLGDPPCI